MVRALVSLITGIASLPVAFLPYGPYVSIGLGIVAIGATARVKDDTRAKIGMLAGLAGIVLALVLLSFTLPTPELN